MSSPHGESGYRIGVDVGGTFTDVVLYEPATNAFRHTKTPSTPAHPETGAINGIRKILDETDTGADEVGRLIHGTTVATNAILERTGANAGLIVTEGTRDILQIRRQNRPHMYDFRKQRDPPVIPRDRVHEIGERLRPDGSVERDPDEDEIRAVVRKLAAQDADSIGVCLLHSYSNDAHERLVRDVISQEFPEARVSLSSEILPEFKEYERMSTTAMNAYLMPVMDEYVNALQEGLDDLGVDVALNIMQSNGGMMTGTTARTRSVQTVLSGPAAGALSGTVLSDRQNFITADMGGTSFDVALCQGGELEFTNESEISGHVIRVPQISIHTIGAGGGSIAWVDRGGALRVGPKSSGADPGPVAYGRGGTDPTVTDAHVVLGRLNQEYLLDGEMEVNLDGAREAIQRAIAEPLDLSLEAAAQGIVDVVNAKMVKGMRVISVERGYNPRDFSLISFGGAGPLHGVELASELDMAEALVPYAPGVNSAVGLLAADYRNDYVETYLEDVQDTDFEEIADMYAGMNDRAIADMEAEGIAVQNVSFVPQIQARYRGQGYNLDVPIDPDRLTDDDAAEAIRERFGERHEREYGFARPEETIEIVNLTLSAIGETEVPDFTIGQSEDEKAEPSAHRSVYFEDEWREVPIYRREDVLYADSIEGPLVVEQHDSTTVVPPGFTLSADEYLNLVISSDE